MGDGGYRHYGGQLGRGTVRWWEKKRGRGCNLYLTAYVGSLTLCNPVVGIFTTSFNVKIKFYFSHTVCVCVVWCVVCVCGVCVVCVCVCVVCGVCVWCVCVCVSGVCVCGVG